MEFILENLNIFIPVLAAPLIAGTVALLFSRFGRSGVLKRLEILHKRAELINLLINNENENEDKKPLWKELDLIKFELLEVSTFERRDIEERKRVYEKSKKQLHWLRRYIFFPFPTKFWQSMYWFLIYIGWILVLLVLLVTIFPDTLPFIDESESLLTLLDVLIIPVLILHMFLFRSMIGYSKKNIFKLD